jgi:hypothetical protein
MAGIRIAIRLEAGPADSTHAHVRYDYHALGRAGERVVEAMTTEAWTTFMREWETELSRWLETGTRLDPRAR